MMSKVAFLISVLSALVQSKVISEKLAAKQEGRIFGGKEALAGQFPYQASLRYSGYHRCGAVIYRHDAVVTAAHCVYGLGVELMEIAVGTIYRNRGGQERAVRLYSTHPDFAPTTFENDIAVVLMQGAVDFSDTIQPIYLASVGEDLKSGTLVTVSGWGSLNDEGHLPDALHYVRIRTVDRGMCAEAYSGINPVNGDMICAGEPEGGKDACYGDSGGPLVVANKLYGIVSWGDACGSPDFPGVYVSIGSHRTWIDKQFR